MRRRRANFLCLVGKGREAQNRLVEAFQKYLELGEEARKDELIQVIDEPSVKAAPDVWSQGRIAAMFANATDAKQKKALEELCPNVPSTYDARAVTIGVRRSEYRIAYVLGGDLVAAIDYLRRFDRDIGRSAEDPRLLGATDGHAVACLLVQAEPAHG